jgi:hypothetical protein
MTITALKRVVVIKSVNIHISTSLSPYPGDVGRHNACPTTTQSCGWKEVGRRKDGRREDMVFSHFWLVENAR